MEKVLMDEELFGQASSGESSGNLPTDYVSSISDLPREVMEVIFEKFDSVNRKRIERVCKGWMQILREAKRFRTHLVIELPSYIKIVGHAHGHWKPSYEDWGARLGHMAKPDLEVLHLKSREVPGNVDSYLSKSNTIGNGIGSILRTLWLAVGHLSTVDIIFCDCTIECELRSGHWRGWWTKNPPNPKTIRIIRSHITASDWFKFPATLFVEELWLDEDLDKRPRQIAELFLAENGPLTEAQSDILRETERHLAELIQFTAGRLSHPNSYLKTYVDAYNWIDVLATIANGGSSLTNRPA